METEVSFEEIFQKKWMQEGGLIIPATAAKIWGCSKGAITKSKLKKIKIQGKVFISYAEVMRTEKEDRPKARNRKKTEEAPKD